MHKQTMFKRQAMPFAAAALGDLINQHWYSLNMQTLYLGEILQMEQHWSDSFPRGLGS